MGTEKTPLPPHRFSPHDVVEVRPSKGGGAADALTSGLVYRVHDDALVIALDDAPDEGLDQPLRLDRLANEVTYRRLRETLQALGKGGLPGSAGPAGLLDVLFGQRVPRFAADPPKWTPFNQRLDASQVRIPHTLLYGVLGALFVLSVL
jgi:ATP-dependent RNA/DNA helicase IGHMBP2